VSPLTAYAPATGKPRAFRAGEIVPKGWMVQWGQAWDTLQDDMRVVVRERAGRPEDAEEVKFLALATPADEAAHQAAEQAAIERGALWRARSEAAALASEQAARDTAIRLIAVRAALAVLEGMPEAEVAELLGHLIGRSGLRRWSAYDGVPKERPGVLRITVNAWGRTEDTGNSYYRVAAGMLLDGPAIAADAATCAEFLLACPPLF